MDNKQVDLLIKSAVALEEVDLDLAYDLIKLAEVHRPNGKTVSDKKKFYESIAEKKNELAEYVLADLRVKHLDRQECKVKTIWFYWDSGYDSAPTLVKRAYATWLIFNPDYTVTFLDKESLNNLVGFQFDRVLDIFTAPVSRAGFSDIIRLYLLYRFGGVWVDATTYCLRPLSHWLSFDDTGFFSFRQPQSCSDRQLVSWFMAAAQGSSIIKLTLNMSLDYLTTERSVSLSPVTGIIPGHRPEDVSREGTGLNYLAYAESCNRFPYFWMFYILNEAVNSNGVNKGIWSRVNGKSNYYAQPSGDFSRFINSHVSKQTYKKSMDPKIQFERDDYLKKIMGDLPSNNYYYRCWQ